MCRHLGYLGPAVLVSEPVTLGANSLRKQSWAPTDMRGGGTVNADGFGVAWWSAEKATHYRNPAPIWSDPAVDDVLSQIRSTAVLGAVRSATVGMPVSQHACAPFVDGAWAFSHNGVVPNWRDAVAKVAPTMSTDRLLRLETPTDSAALWLCVLDALQTAEPAVVLGDVVRRILDVEPTARLNLLLSDGKVLWATTCYHSLAVLVADTSVVVASEPTDADPRWREIPDRSLITARPGNVSIQSL